MKKRITKNSIKETFDDLPIGICYFDKNGFPVLCNRQMYRLVFAISDRDLQMLSDLTDALRDYHNKDGELLILEDGTVWQFKAKTVTAEAEYTQYIASDITELYQVKNDLERENEEYSVMLQNIKKISCDMVAITREEEILTLKTKIHNKVGACLQRLRRCIVQSPEDADFNSIVPEMQSVADMLMRETGGNDEPDLMEELFALANKLGVDIKVTGELPQEGETAVLLAYVLHECLINTVSHAGGDELYVNITDDSCKLTAVVTNNGTPPIEEIIEGGGLSTLRKRIENAGGAMSIVSLPRFAMRIVLNSDQSFSSPDHYPPITENRRLLS